MPTNVEFILYAVRQTREAEEYGFTRNECCRNLKIALVQFWQTKTLGMSGLSQKSRIPRSGKAAGLALKECVVEHTVPQQVIVNMLVDHQNLSTKEVESILKKFFVVRLVSKDEDAQLRSSGLRSVMPDDWDGRDPFARYRKVGIQVPE